ncbi:MAG: hypothetical protein ACTSPV_00560 [Candidatus Hodarchaeales archaeon]
MSNPAWKKYERRIAAALGGRRVRAGELEQEDVEHSLLSIEVKLLKNLPKGLTNPYKQAKRNAPKGKIPIVIMKEKKRFDDNALVFLRFKDFKRLMTPIIGKSGQVKDA